MCVTLFWSTSETQILIDRLEIRFVVERVLNLYKTKIIPCIIVHMFLYCYFLVSFMIEKLTASCGLEIIVKSSEWIPLGLVSLLSKILCFSFVDVTVNSIPKLIGSKCLLGQ